MTDQQERPTGQAPLGGGPAGEGAPTTREVEEGRTFAILSYVLGFIGLPFFLVPLIMRNNEFSLYHSKQCLMLWLVAIVGGVASSVLMLICVGAILAVVVTVCCLVLNILGLMNAVKGLQAPLPLIGKLAEDWFKGIRKA